MALCSLATWSACNNPNCSNMAGPSDAEIVSGRSYVQRLQDGSLLLQGLPEAAVEASQASLCGISGRSSIKVWSRGKQGVTGGVVSMVSWCCF
jgi:hypothetical protein